MNLPDCPPGTEGYEDALPICAQPNLEGTKAEKEFQSYAHGFKLKLQDGSVRNMFERKERDAGGQWVYLCYPCGATCNGESTMQNHIIGKKHLIRMENCKVWPLRIFYDHPYYHEGAGKNKTLPAEPARKPYSVLDYIINEPCALQPVLDEHKSSALLGLEYLIELDPEEVHHVPQYHCMLCDKPGQPRSIINHLKSWGHRRRFVDSHYWTARQALALFEKQGLEKGIRAVLDTLATRIEQVHGRMKPLRTTHQHFQRHRADIFKHILNGPHISEKNGENFLEVVDKDLIHFLSKGGTESDLKKKEPSPPVVAVPRPSTGKQSGPKAVTQPTAQPKQVARHGSTESLSSISLSSPENSPELSNNRQKRKAGFERSAEYVKRVRQNSPLPRGVDMFNHMKLQKKLNILETAVQKLVQDSNKKLSYHEKNPEKHPLYPEEWKKFWNRRYKELQNENKDPTKFDFKPEWIVFWTKRLKELHDEEFQSQKNDECRRLNVPLDVVDGKGVIVARGWKGGVRPSHTPERSLPRRSAARRASPRRMSPRRSPRRYSPRRSPRRSPARRGSPRRRSPPRRYSPVHARSRYPRSPPRHRTPPLHRPPARPAARTEAGHTEAGHTEAGHTEAGHTEAGHTKAGHTEAGHTEARRTEAGRNEAGRTEAGRTDVRPEVHAKPRSPPRRTDRNNSAPRESSVTVISDDEMKLSENENDNISPWGDSDSLKSVESTSARRSTPSSVSRRPVTGGGGRPATGGSGRPATGGSGRAAAGGSGRAAAGGAGAVRSMGGLPLHRDDVVSALRVLSALEDYLGSIGSRIVDLLAQALKMEKNRPNSSEELLLDEANCVLVDTAKEKLKGAVHAGLVPSGVAGAARDAITRTAELLHQAEVLQKSHAEKEKADKLKASKEGVCVAGVGAVEKAAIARQIAAALVAQGKTDVTTEELATLVDAVIGMANAKRNTAQDKRTTTQDESSTKVEPATTQSQASGSALQMLCAAYDETARLELQEKPKQDEKRNNRDEKRNEGNAQKREDRPKEVEERPSMDGLSDSDLKTLLQNFKDLSSDEQHDLIGYLRKLESREPVRVERLRQFVNLQPTLTAAIAPVPHATALDSDDDDYTVDEVFKSAALKVKENQMQQEMEVVQKSLQQVQPVEDATKILASLLSSLAPPAAPHVQGAPAAAARAPAPAARAPAPAARAPAAVARAPSTESPHQPLAPTRHPNSFDEHNQRDAPAVRSHFQGDAPDTRNNFQDDATSYHQLNRQLERPASVEGGGYARREDAKQMVQNQSMPMQRPPVVQQFAQTNSGQRENSFERMYSKRPFAQESDGASNHHYEEYASRNSTMPTTYAGDAYAEEAYATGAYATDTYTPDTYAAGAYSANAWGSGPQVQQGNQGGGGRGGGGQRGHRGRGMWNNSQRGSNYSNYN